VIAVFFSMQLKKAQKKKLIAAIVLLVIFLLSSTLAIIANAQSQEGVPTFQEAGLPAGTPWSITVANRTYTTTSSYISIVNASGEWSVADSGLYEPSPASGYTISDNFVYFTEVKPTISASGPYNYSSSFGGQEITWRNPDGSFYPSEMFYVYYSAGTTLPLPSGYTLSVTSPWLVSLGSGMALLSVPAGTSPGVYPVQMIAEILSGNIVQETAVSLVNVTVVAYNPQFQLYTYPLYNDNNSSSYMRPFVTIARYMGNVPGLPGYNGTTEPAYVSNFTFSSTKYLVNYTNTEVAGNVTYTPSSASLNVKTDNSSVARVLWNGTIVKYYFTANATQLAALVNKNYLYVQVRETADSPYGVDWVQYYLFQPIDYNGFVTYSGNVSLIEINPSPLDNFIASQVQANFGTGWQQVLNDMNSDLYAAYGYMVLKPFSQYNGFTTYLINQTSFGSYPLVYVNSSSIVSSIPWALTSSPFTPFSAFGYLVESGNAVVTPLSFSFNASYFYAMITPPSGRQPFAETVEPGEETTTDTLYWGVHSYINTFSNISIVSWYQSGDALVLYLNTTNIYEVEAGGVKDVLQDIYPQGLQPSGYNGITQFNAPAGSKTLTYYTSFGGIATITLPYSKMPGISPSLSINAIYVFFIVVAIIALLTYIQNRRQRPSDAMLNNAF
jgi:hypothetical protein